jgi:hypothetical protein
MWWQNQSWWEVYDFIAGQPDRTMESDYNGEGSCDIHLQLHYRSVHTTSTVDLLEVRTSYQRQPRKELVHILLSCLFS